MTSGRNVDSAVSKKSSIEILKFRQEKVVCFVQR